MFVSPGLFFDSDFDLIVRVVVCLYERWREVKRMKKREVVRKRKRMQNQRRKENGKQKQKQGEEEVDKGKEKDMITDDQDEDEQEDEQDDEEGKNASAPVNRLLAMRPGQSPETYAKLLFSNCQAGCVIGSAVPKCQMIDFRYDMDDDNNDDSDEDKEEEKKVGSEEGKGKDKEGVKGSKTKEVKFEYGYEVVYIERCSGPFKVVQKGGQNLIVSRADGEDDDDEVEVEVGIRGVSRDGGKI